MKKISVTRVFRLLAPALVIISCWGCKSRAAFDYSENFVKKEKSLSADITSTELKVGRYMEAEQYDSIAIASEKMEAEVDAVMKQVKDEPAPAVKEGDNFKEAGVKYFAFIKSMYTAYKEFGNAKSTDGRQAALDKIKDIVARRTDAVSEIQQAQRKFADANGFQVQKK